MPTNGYAHLDSVTGQVPGPENSAFGFKRVAITKTFADVAVAALTNEINLITLPANIQVLTAAAVVNTPGDSVTTLTFSTGFLAINPTALMTPQDGLAPAATSYTGNGSTLINGALTISSTFISTVANLDTMTQGSWTFYISYIEF